MDLFIWVYSILLFPFSKSRPPPPLLKFQLKFQLRHYLWGNVGVCALVKIQLFGIIRNSNNTLLLFEDIYRYLQMSIFSIITLCGATRNVTENIEFQHDWFFLINTTFLEGWRFFYHFRPKGTKVSKFTNVLSIVEFSMDTSWRLKNVKFLGLIWALGNKDIKFKNSTWHYWIRDDWFVTETKFQGNQITFSFGTNLDLKE